MISVRRARPEEYDLAGEITVAAYATLPGDHLADGYDEELRAAKRRAEEAVLLVAVDGDEVLGSVTYVPDAGSPWAEGLADGQAGIRMLAVSPAAQGRGAGEALMRACLARAAEEGKRAIALHSTAAMAAAHRLYGRLGFVRTPERDWEPVPGLLLLGFGLELGR